jgi:hypothetical protein
VLNLVRFVLQCLIALLLVVCVISVFASDASTGTAEKIVIGVFAVGLIYAAAHVRRIGAGPEARA